MWFRSIGAAGRATSAICPVSSTARWAARTPRPATKRADGRRARTGRALRRCRPRHQEACVFLSTASVRNSKTIQKSECLLLPHKGRDQCYGQCDAGGCTYCERWAQDAVRVDMEAVGPYVEAVGQLISPTLSLGPSDAKTRVCSHDDHVVWPPDVDSLFEQLIDSVPEMFRDVARRQIRGRAMSMVVDEPLDIRVENDSESLLVVLCRR